MLISDLPLPPIAILDVNNVVIAGITIVSIDVTTTTTTAATDAIVIVDTTVVVIIVII